MNTAFIYLAPKILGDPAMSAFNRGLNLLEYASSCHWQQVGDDVYCRIDFEK